MKKSFILLLSVMPGFYTTTLLAQNSVKISGNTCVKSVLTAQMNSAVQKIEWRLNGQVISTRGASRQGVTVAGGNGPGYGSDQLYYPNGVFIDGEDNLWVADASNGRVQKFLPGSTNGITIGNNLPNAPGFPVNVFVCPDGSIYVADYFEGKVKMLKKDGTRWINVAGQHNELDLVRGVWVDKDGNVYCTQYGFYFNGTVKLDGMILKYPPRSSAWEIVAGGNGVGSGLNQFSQPTSVMLDDERNIYVADSRNDHGLDNARVMKWAPGSAAGEVVAGGNGVGVHRNQCPYAFHAFVQKNKTVFVSNSGEYNAVTKWIPGIENSSVAAGGNGLGDAPDQFNGANGIFIKGKYLYVVDGSNHRVQRFDLSESPNKSEFIARHPGTYTAVVTFENGTAATSNAIIISTCPENNAEASVAAAVIKGGKNQDLVVYPNPVKNTLTINYVANKEGKGVFEMMDLSGKVIVHKEISMIKGTNRSTADVSHFAGGVYFIRVTKPDKTKEVIQVNKE